METAAKQNRPLQTDGWTDGFIYPSGDRNGIFVTSWCTPIFCDNCTKIKIEGTGALSGALCYMNFLDENLNYVTYLTVYDRTADLTSTGKYMVFTCDVRHKNTIKITDLTHGVVLFENGHANDEGRIS